VPLRRSASPAAASIYLDPKFEAEELNSKDDKKRNRLYAFDASPKLLFCDGVLVDALLAAGAGSYAEFKLVGSHLVWVSDDEDEDGEKVEKKGAEKKKRRKGGRLVPLPASRADVFRDRTLPLASKRAVMRFLQHAANAVMGEGGPLATALEMKSTSTETETTTTSTSSSSSSPFSPETPFAAVVASYKLPKGASDAILYGLAGADVAQERWSSSEDAEGGEGEREASLTTTTTSAFSDTVAEAPRWASAPLRSSDAAFALRRHLLSLGKFGETTAGADASSSSSAAAADDDDDAGRSGRGGGGSGSRASALLAPLYGTGELAQAFVRASAVAGGVAALRRRVVSAEVVVGSSPPVVKGVVLSSGQRLSCGALAGDPLVLRRLFSSSFDDHRRSPNVARCVAVLDGPPPLSSSSPSISSSSTTTTATTAAPALLPASATAALVFPPRCLSSSHPRHAVRGLVLGSATAAAPEGRWLLYLSTPLTCDEGGEGGGEKERDEGEKNHNAAEAALSGVLSLLARPPSSSASPQQREIPRALDHRPSALLAAFFDEDAGGGGGEGTSCSPPSFSLPSNAAATACPDGRMSADDGALASAWRVLERLFPGQAVAELLLEKHKKKAKKERNDDDEEGRGSQGEATVDSSSSAAARNAASEKEKGYSSDEDAASDLAAILAALDAKDEKD